MKVKITNEMLEKYAIFHASKQLDEQTDLKLSPDEETYLEQKLSRDPDLAGYVKFLMQGYKDIHKRIGDSEIGELNFQPAKSKRFSLARENSFLRQNKILRYSLALAAIISVFLVSAYLMMRISAPGSHSLVAQILAETSLPATRSETPAEIDAGILAFGNKNYAHAADFFIRAFRLKKEAFGEQSAAVYAYYAGISFLQAAHEENPKGDNATWLDSAKTYLEIAESHKSSYPYIMEEQSLYSGIVELLLYTNRGDKSNLTNATQHLTRSVSENNRFSDLAQGLLERVQKNQIHK